MMKKILFSIYLSMAALLPAAFAQPINTATPDAMVKAAAQAELEGNPYAALEFYEKAAKETKDRAHTLKVAELNYKLRDYDRTAKALGRLITRDRKRELTEYKYLYAMALKQIGNCAEAVPMFEDYVQDGTDPKLQARAKLEIAGCKMIKDLKPADNLAIGNLGKNVNGKQTEGSPIFNEGKLYYSAIVAKEVIDAKASKDWEAKIYSSGMSPEGFGKGEALGQQINREGNHQGNVYITKDGKVMYFTRVQLEGQTLSESKIYYSMNSGGEWGAANEVIGVNGDYIAKHPTLGELFGETVMFFVAEIPGGQGGDDIYYAPRKSDGVFGAPVNLGAGINTAGTEATPFYHQGKLYFSSDGYPSIGGLDVFQADWNGTAWSKPENMKQGINSPQDDWYFSTGQDGKSGLFVSNRESENSLKSKTCCDDMFAWELEQVKVTLDVTTFRFKKKDEKTNPPLNNCTLQVFDVTDKSPNKTDTRTNANANNFQFTLYPEKEYMVIATNPGYQNDTLRLNTVGVTKSKSIAKTMTLRTERKKDEPKPVSSDSTVVTINETIRLNNIYYDLDDDKILPDAESDLTVILGLMNQYSDMKIELSSHTDAQGKDDYNMNLSQRRADSARRWLIAKGISGDRIVPRGYGETIILNQCTNGVKCSDDEHRFNRRTEFKIIEGPTTITIKKMEVKTRTGGKQSWNSFIYDLLQDKPAGIFGYWPNQKDTSAPTGEGYLFEGIFSSEATPTGPVLTAKGGDIPSEATIAAEATLTVEVVQETEEVIPQVVEFEQPVSYSTQAVEPAIVKTIDTWVNPADVMMSFHTKNIDFGKAKEGELVERIFTFTNTQDETLFIEVVAACDCITHEYTTQGIYKGESGFIKVVLDTNEQRGQVRKTIDVVFSNMDSKGYPLIQQLFLTGNVN